MANKQINELTEKTEVIDADLLVLYDTEEAGPEATKKIPYSAFKLLSTSGDVYNRSGEPQKIVDAGAEVTYNFIGGLSGFLHGTHTGLQTGPWTMGDSLTLTSDTNLFDGDFAGNAQNIILDGSSNSVQVTNWRPTLGRFYCISCSDSTNLVKVVLDDFFTAYFRGGNGGGANEATFNNAYSFIVVFRPNDDFVMVVQDHDMTFVA